MLNAAIIDDERLARLELRHLLGAFPEITIVGEAAHADEARTLIRIAQPDLIFLDISMPGETGFDLLASLETAPHVIFVTAYDQYALRAFEVNALDYVLKPVNPERLLKAIEKVQRDIAQAARKQAAIAAEPRLTPDKQVFIKDGEKCYFVQIGDIQMITSVGNYAKIHVGKQTPLLHKSLTALEERLPEDLFFRANRQQILNLRHVARIEPYFKGALLAVMTSGEQVEISTRQTTRFRELMSL